jgi:hypothetical protein
MRYRTWPSITYSITYRIWYCMLLFLTLPYDIVYNIICCHMISYAIFYKTTIWCVNILCTLWTQDNQSRISGSELSFRIECTVCIRCIVHSVNRGHRRGVCWCWLSIFLSFLFQPYRETRHFLLCQCSPWQQIPCLGYSLRPAPRPSSSRNATMRIFDGSVSSHKASSKSCSSERAASAVDNSRSFLFCSFLRLGEH